MAFGRIITDHLLYGSSISLKFWTRCRKQIPPLIETSLTSSCFLRSFKNWFIEKRTLLWFRGFDPFIIKRLLNGHFYQKNSQLDLLLTNLILKSWIHLILACLSDPSKNFKNFISKLFIHSTFQIWLWEVSREKRRVHICGTRSSTSQSDGQKSYIHILL